MYRFPISKGAFVEQFAETRTLPLSIAHVDPSVYVEPGLAEAPSAVPVVEGPSDPLALHEQLVAAVAARAGEVEAAEWALDQAKAAYNAQILAALSAGIAVEKVAAAAGVDPAALADSVGEPSPAAT
jgi:hypothetical protein